MAASHATKPGEEDGSGERSIAAETVQADSEAAPACASAEPSSTGRHVPATFNSSPNVQPGPRATWIQHHTSGAHLFLNRPRSCRYVQEEFRAHKKASTEQVSVFMAEWGRYTSMLEEQSDKQAKQAAEVQPQLQPAAAAGWSYS